MKLLFIDETSDTKYTEYLGFCIASMDSKSYSLVKSKAQKILKDIEWDDHIEFKGSYLFSASKGCSDVEIEKRIEAAEKLLDLNAGKNSRIRFDFGKIESKNHGKDYLDALPTLIEKTLQKPSKGAGKNLVMVICDERSDVPLEELNSCISDSVKAKGYTIIEQVVQARSSFDTVGLMYADLVGYLAGRVDNISKDVELFDGLTKDQLSKNGKFKKLKSSSRLIQKIKRINLYYKANDKKKKHTT